MMILIKKCNFIKVFNKNARYFIIFYKNNFYIYENF